MRNVAFLINIVFIYLFIIIFIIIIIIIIIIINIIAIFFVKRPSQTHIAIFSCCC